MSSKMLSGHGLTIAFQSSRGGEADLQLCVIKLTLEKWLLARLRVFQEGLGLFRSRKMGQVVHVGAAQTLLQPSLEKLSVGDHLYPRFVG